MKRYTLSWDGHRLELGTRTFIMGVLNVTPDSFSDGGKFFDPDTAVARGIRMFSEGADIVDIGGESTRPFSDAVSAAAEADRVLPVIERLAKEVSVPISIDTTKAAVARRALEAGAAIINDVSALRSDPEMASVAAQYGVPVILMHMKGTPKTMQMDPSYDDLTGEIRTFFRNTLDHAAAAGIDRGKLIIDPGIGFGKTMHHNLCLLNRLDAFAALDAPILVGSSRKAFIRNLLKDQSPEEITPDLPLVETGTQATVAAAVLRGAHIVRVHNVANTRATVTLIDAIRNASDRPSS